MAALTVQTIGVSGLVPTYAAAAAGGDTFANDGRTMFHFKNADTVTHTATINSLATCNFGFDHDAVVAVTASEDERMIGPFPINRFGANVSVTYDAVTSVTVAAIKLP